MDNIIQFESKNVKITPYGIEFTGQLSIEEWYDIFSKVQKAHSMMQFYLGDLIVYAESPITGWGESKYKELIELTGYSFDTLVQYATVSRKFPLGGRRETLVGAHERLTWTDFKEVTPVKDDTRLDNFLRLTNDSGWSTDKLRGEVKNFLHPQLPEPEERDVTETTVLLSDQQKIHALRESLQAFVDYFSDDYEETLAEMPEYQNALATLEATK